MSARENILRRIRARQAKPADVTAGEREEVRDYLLARARGPCPRWTESLLERFTERARALGSTVDRVEGQPAVPRALARYLAAHSLPPRVVGWPRCPEHDWRGAGVAFAARPAGDGDAVGMTGAYCGIAESGTLVLLSGPAHPLAPSLLPETHVIVIAAEQLVGTMEDAWQRLREERGAPPRAVHLVSGPSRTADIEQTVTLGAHGPYRVHIILVH